MNYLREISQKSSYQPTGGDLNVLYQKMVVHGLSREIALKDFKNSKYFNKVHYELKNNLVAGVCTYNFKRQQTYNRAKFKVLRNVAAARILMSLENLNAGIKLAKETLKIAEKFGWINDCLQLNRELAMVMNSKSSKERQELRDKVELYRRYLKNECDSETLLAEASYLAGRGMSAQHLVEEYERLLNVDDQNHRFQFYLRYAGMMIASANNNDDEAYRICEDAVTFFDGFDAAFHYVTKWHFMFQLIPHYISKRKYDRVENYLNQSLALVRNGSYNQSVNLIYKALYGFSTNKPKIALAAWKLQRRVGKKFENEQVVEWWRIIHAYLSWYEKIGKITGVGKFRLGKFMNEVPLSNRDKDGLNFSIRIVQLLHYLAENNRSKYMDGIEPLEQYVKANLRKDRRGQLFTKLLKHIELQDYSRSRIENITEEILVKLRHEPRPFSVKVLEKELVPYELIWREVLKLLR